MTDIVERLREGKYVGGKWVMQEAADEIERLREGLQLIANNSCCGTCQEAALVAKRTLEGK